MISQQFFFCIDVSTVKRFTVATNRFKQVDFTRGILSFVLTICTLMSQCFSSMYASRTSDTEHILVQTEKYLSSKKEMYLKLSSHLWETNLVSLIGKNSSKFTSSPCRKNLFFSFFLYPTLVTLVTLKNRTSITIFKDLLNDFKIVLAMNHIGC